MFDISLHLKTLGLEVHLEGWMTTTPKHPKETGHTTPQNEEVGLCGRIEIEPYIYLTCQYVSSHFPPHV